MSFFFLKGTPIYLNFPVSEHRSRMLQKDERSGVTFRLLRELKKQFESCQFTYFKVGELVMKLSKNSLDQNYNK